MCGDFKSSPEQEIDVKRQNSQLLYLELSSFGHGNKRNLLKIKKSNHAELANHSESMYGLHECLTRSSTRQPSLHLRPEKDDDDDHKNRDDHYQKDVSQQNRQASLQPDPNFAMLQQLTVSPAKIYHPKHEREQRHRPSSSRNAAQKL